MHGHTLHRPVEVECTCCAVIQEFVFKSATDHVICKGCLRHQGEAPSKLRQRDTDHRGLWRSELGVLREDLATSRATATERAAESRRLLRVCKAENETLRQSVREGLSDASPGDVQAIMRDQVVKDAQDQRDAGYRARDRAYRALWAVDELHHRESVHDTRCSCGQASTSCRVLVAVELDVEDLRRWERTQRERAREGKPHGLPHDHPNYRDVSH